MEVLFSVKIFDVEFSSDLYALRSPESKKIDFWKLVCAYVSECDSKVNIWHFIFSELIKIETLNFIHSTRLVDRFPGFDENRK